VTLVIKDRVRDSTTSTGTGPITLSGVAPQGYRTFSAVCVSGSTVWYCIQHRTANEWEIGVATSDGANTLTRTQVLSSSNADALVSFSAGTKDVFLTQPADRIAWADQTSQLRRTLTADEQFYVSGSGNDVTGDGSSATPWQTLTRANNYIRDFLNFGGFRVDLIMKDAGTYAGVLNLGGYFGGGLFVIRGNTTTKTDFVITEVNFPALMWVTLATSTGIIFDQCTFKNTASAVGLDCVKVSTQAEVFVAAYGGIGLAQSVHLDFSSNPTNPHGFVCQNGGLMRVAGSNTIAVGATGMRAMYLAIGPDDNWPGASFLYGEGTWALSAALNFTSAGAVAGDGCTVWYFDSFTGFAVTGKRFRAYTNGVIGAFTAPSNLPGSTPGTLETGGQFL
jgi:hypothetical protein